MKKYRVELSAKAEIEFHLNSQEELDAAMRECIEFNEWGLGDPFEACQFEWKCLEILDENESQE